MRKSRDGASARTVAERCSRAAAPDVELGVALLRVAFSGARANLEMRLSTLTEVAHTTAIVEEMARLSDEATCYKAFRTSTLRRMDLQCERFEFCPEVTAKACRMGLKIYEVPIGYHARSYRDGKKIRWHDGVMAMATLLRWRFAPFSAFRTVEAGCPAMAGDSTA